MFGVMSLQEKIDQLISLAEQVCSTLGFEVVDARVTQQGKRRSIEVTIHKLGGRVGLDDCEDVSRKLEALIDEQSPPVFEGPFMLEVQSPGIDRQLKTDRELRIFSGEKVEIKAKEIIPELGDTFSGVLKGTENGFVHIEFPRAIQRSSKKKVQALHPTPPDEIQLEMSKLFSIKLLPEPPQQKQKEQLNIGGPQP
jgi:ribosome maturation factor RimP